MGLIKDAVFYLHPAGGVELTAKEVEWDTKGKFGPQIVVKFESEEYLPEESGKDEPFSLMDWFNPTFNDKSRLKQLLKAYGAPVDDPKWQADLKAIEEPEELCEFIGDIIVGRKVQGMIVHKTAADKTEKHSIDAYAPIRQRRSRRAPEEAPAEEPAKEEPAPRSRREQEEANERPRRSRPAQDDYEDDDQ